MHVSDAVSKLRARRSGACFGHAETQTERRRLRNASEAAPAKEAPNRRGLHHTFQAPCTKQAPKCNGNFATKKEKESKKLRIQKTEDQQIRPKMASNGPAAPDSHAAGASLRCISCFLSTFCAAGAPTAENSPPEAQPPATSTAAATPAPQSDDQMFLANRPKGVTVRGRSASNSLTCCVNFRAVWAQCPSTN